MIAFIRDVSIILAVSIYAYTNEHVINAMILSLQSLGNS